MGMATDVEAHRGSQVLLLPGAIATIVGPRTIQVNIEASPEPVYRFLDDRVYPWDSSMIRVGDVNHNGILGHTLAMSLIVPGNPA